MSDLDFRKPFFASLLERQTMVSDKLLGTVLGIASKAFLFENAKADSTKSSVPSKACDSDQKGLTKERKRCRQGRKKANQDK